MNCDSTQKCPKYPGQFTLSQLLLGKKAVGPKIARRLERDYGIPRGYLDGLDSTEGQAFGERLKSLRKSRDLTQVQLAEFIGVTQTAVGSWESGKRAIPKGTYLLKLAEALGYEASELVASTIESPKASIEEVHLLAAFRSLTKDRQVIALKLVEALK